MRYCPNCGNNVRDDDKFCSGCGKSFGNIHTIIEEELVVTCAHCDGTGKIDKGSLVFPLMKPCPVCGGAGKVRI